MDEDRLNPEVLLITSVSCFGTKERQFLEVRHTTGSPSLKKVVAIINLKYTVLPCMERLEGVGFVCALVRNDERK